MNNIFRKWDQWLDRLDERQTPSETDSLERIRANLLARIPPSGGKPFTLLLTGSIGRERIRWFAERLSAVLAREDPCPIHLCWSGSAVCDADAIEKAVQSDGVALIEWRDVSTRADLKAELEALGSLGKKPLGIILIT